jgi:hypothetical protein
MPQSVAAEFASERGQSSPSAACSMRRIGSHNAVRVFRFREMRH